MRRRRMTLTPRAAGAPSVNDTWDSAAALWAHAARTPSRIGDGPALNDTTDDMPSPWNGNTTMQQALDLGAHGWPEGLAKVAPVIARVDELIAHALPVKVIAYDVVGDAPDVGAYLSGVPENMLTFEDGERPNRMARVIVNVGASCAVKPETLEARGVIACALVDALERSGFRCEILVVHNTLGANGVMYNKRVLLKRAEDPLSMDMLTFPLVHPSMLRRIMFRCLELLPESARRGIGSGYGKSQAVVGEPGDIVIGELYGTGWTPENCAREVVKYLKEVGVHVEDDGLKS